MNKKARRTTVAPVCFIEHTGELIIGDKYIKVMSFWGYPTMFTEGFLAPLIGGQHYYVDMLTEQTDLDYASVLKGERNDIQEKLSKSTDPSEIEELSQRREALDEFIQENVRMKSSTINCICQLYIKANTREELNEYVKEVKNTFGSSAVGISLRCISLLQQGLFRKNTPLFINHGLRKEPDYLNGQPMSSQTVAGLWPWIFDTLDDPQGTLIAREMTSGGKIIFDQFFYRNNPALAKEMNRPNGNMVIIGRSGTGKTTTMNLLIHGHIINHRKIVWLDPENKNETLCRYVHGNYVALGLDGNIINIFDLKPLSTDSDQKESKEIKYSNNAAIMQVIEEIKITFSLLWPNISDDAMAMIGEIVVRTYESVGISTEGTFEHMSVENYPTFTNFTATIKRMIEDMKRSGSKEHERELQALKELEMRMRSITGSNGVEGEYGKYFDGTTTIASDSLESTGMIAIGTKHLFNVTPNLKNALLRMVFNYAWSLCLGHEEMPTVFVNDEQHMFIEEPSLASILAVFQRRARKYNTVTLSGTQEVVEYTNPQILKDGKAIFNNACYQVYMNLTKDAITDLGKLISLSDGEMETLEQLRPWQGIFVCGNKRIPVEFLATERELSLM